MAQSYKIFIKDVPLIIGGTDYTPTGNEYVVPENEFIAGIEERMNWFLHHHSGSKILVPAGDTHALMQKIKKALHPIDAAGGLVYNDENHLLMIFRRGKWDLPKGKVDPGETISAAALREVEEETGVGGLSLGDKRPSTFHIYEEKGGLIIKETHWYAMRCFGDPFLVPQLEENITGIEWVGPHTLHQKMMNTYASVREVLGL